MGNRLWDKAGIRRSTTISAACGGGEGGERGKREEEEEGRLPVQTRAGAELGVRSMRSS